MMRLHVGVLTIAALTACSPGDGSDSLGDRPDFPTIGSIERLDPAFDEIIPQGVVVEVIAEGHTWTEGPLWVPDLDALLYSDAQTNEIYRWSEAAGSSLWLARSGHTGPEPFRREPGSNGLALDAQGRLLLAQHGDRRIARLSSSWDNPAPDYETVVDAYQGRKLNSPNDLVVDRRGRVIFSDPPYGHEDRWDDPALELDVFGVYRVTPDGEVELLVDDLPGPNGLALSPDEVTLYVASTGGQPRGVMAYDLGTDGATNGRQIFEERAVSVDVDSSGNLFITGRNPDAIYVLSPDGVHLGSIVIPQDMTNVAFDAQETVLFITAGASVLRVRMVVE